MSSNDCLKNVGEAKTYGFELVGSQIQFCLHRGTEWQDCYLLIKLGDEVKEIRFGEGEVFTDEAIKKLFCSLFTLAEGEIWTGIIAVVLGVIAASILSGSIFPVFGSISTKTGLHPFHQME